MRGIGVHIGARTALAGPGEVLATSTVRDLVAGSEIDLRIRRARTERRAGEVAARSRYLGMKGLRTGLPLQAGTPSGGDRGHARGSEHGATCWRHTRHAASGFEGPHRSVSPVGAIPRSFGVLATPPWPELASHLRIEERELEAAWKEELGWLSGAGKFALQVLRNSSQGRGNR